MPKGPRTTLPERPNAAMRFARNQAHKREMLEEFLAQSASGGLLKDLNHPDAAYVAWRSGRIGGTTFDRYTRPAPRGGAFLLVAGLEFALDFIRTFRYEE